MRYISVKSLIFIVLLSFSGLFILRILEYYKIYAPYTDETVQLIYGNYNAKVVFFGSSYTYSSILPSIIENINDIENVLNLGIATAGPKYQLIMLEQYLKHNIKPDLIVIETQLYMFSNRMDNPDYNPIKYFNSNRFDTYLNHYGINGLFFYINGLFKNIKGKLNSTFNMVYGVERKKTYKGFIYDYNEIDDDEEINRKWLISRDEIVNRKKINHFDELLSYLDEKKIQYILYEPPFYPKFEDQITELKKVFDDILNLLVDKHDVNYFKVTQNSNSSYFREYDHSNAIGADYFSNQIANYINNHIR